MCVVMEVSFLHEESDRKFVLNSSFCKEIYVVLYVFMDGCHLCVEM